MTETGNLGSVDDPAAPKDRVAFIVIGGDREVDRWSAARVHARADAVARALASRGLPAGSSIAILAENHAEFFPAFLGILRAGLVACPLSWKVPADRLAHVLADAGARLVLADDARMAAVPGSVPAVSLDAGYDRWVDPGPFAAVRPDAGAVACLMYTSGSTGVPKGVPITHRGYLAGLAAFESDRARAAGTTTLVAAPLYHMNGQSYALSALYFGSAVVLLRRFDVETYARAIDEYRVDEVSGVPTMLAMALDWAERGHPIDGRHVSLVSSGSAPLSGSLAARLRHAFPKAALVNSYGTTETGIAAFGPDPAGRTAPDGALGVPLPGIGVRLRGGGDEGELELRTPMMAAGYHRRPDETRARFAEGWYRTGDVVRRDSNGWYFFVGRADDMLVCGGENVYPAEVERVLESHEDVLQAAVVGLADPVKGQVPVAFVVIRSGSRVTEAELERFARERGASYARPRRIELMESLPLGSTNKLDRRALEARAAERWG